MITTGIDAVDICRFKDWSRLKVSTLQKIFTSDEVDYCLSIPGKEAERFAVRFAAKEALYKALPQPHSISFLKFCKITEITKDINGSISISCPFFANSAFSCSLTHTATLAIAFVSIQPRAHGIINIVKNRLKNFYRSHLP